MSQESERNDIRIYGSAVKQTIPDGTVKRIDPTTIRIISMSQESEQAQDMNEGKFVDIVGYEGLYQISESGDVVRSLIKNINLLFTTTHKGYKVVFLYKNKVRRLSQIHRLVAKTFIPNPGNKEQVNHKDGNPANNCVLNLEWNTPKENINHAIDTGLRNRTNMHLAKIELIAVPIIREAHKLGHTQRAISKYFKVHNGTISRIILGKTFKINEFEPSLVTKQIEP